MAKSRGSSLVQRVVTLEVGPDKKPFVVDPVLLGRHVPFFEKAFSSDFSQAHTSTMSLPEEDPNIFSVFLLWVYTNGQLPSSSLESEDGRNTPLYVCLYILGEKWCCEKLKDNVFALLLVLLKKNFILEEAWLAAYGASKGARTRPLLVRYLAGKTIRSLVTGKKGWSVALVEKNGEVASDVAFYMAENLTSITRYKENFMARVKWIDTDYIFMESEQLWSGNEDSDEELLAVESPAPSDG